jgi:hypothetical protein
VPLVGAAGGARRVQRAYIFTAIRPATGEDITLALPTIDTGAMQVFLDHVAASSPAEFHSSWCST